MPLIERRQAIISGSVPATSEEVEEGEKKAAESDEEYKPLAPGSATAPIPNFWPTVLHNHLGISELITERDDPALKHLTDVRISYTTSDDEHKNLGFKLEFVFSPNDFFENEVLSKTYLYQTEVDYNGDFVYDRAIGTDIRWKEDKDLTKEFEVKKQKNKSEHSSLLFLLSLVLIPGRDESHTSRTKDTPG